METAKFQTVDAYIASCPAGIRPKLQQLRKIIRETAPGAEESISYNMPGYKFKGPLVYFASNKAHIGFYPTPSPLTAMEKELAGYKTSKGAIQFPHDKPLPVTLVKKILKFKLKENEAKEKAKKTSKRHA